jgi:polyhydroxyalkanoate synthase
MDKHKVQDITNNFLNMFNVLQDNAFAALKEMQTEYSAKTDPVNLNNTLLHSYKELFLNHPDKLLAASFELAKNYIQIYNNVQQRQTSGNKEIPIYQSATKDSRFKDPMWDEQPMFSFIKQSYLMQSAWIQDLLQTIHGLDKKEQEKLTFYTKQLIDALAPTNFAFMNPEAIKEAIATEGQSLVKGLENFTKDLQNSPNGTFSIKSTDYEAFTVGENLAVTKGKVVFENELFQLIQYEATTDKVFSIPLLIMPAWINKYYILDLQQKNSFVKWIVDQGFTVFMISWVNPGAELADQSYVNYMIDGAIAAVQQVQKITNSSKINMVGYCLGGTLLATALAYLIKKEKTCSINSATFLTTLIDFEECGDVAVFIDDEQIANLEKRMNGVGYLDAAAMRQTFSMLRANDMIWSFYVNNYLLGKEPMAFDILYWNADSTNLPAAMHSYYLRNMYNQNLLSKPNGLTINDIGIDLRDIDIPTYSLATKEDHIAPWHSVFKAMSLYKGSNRFVLSASGHVAGVVNHPDKQKYCYWTNEELSDTADSWLQKAQEHPGSWWKDWFDWLAKYSGDKVAKKEIDNKTIIEDAPGRYVKKRVV